jgi:glutamate-1-semialdehyde 2,1-aminomutase
MAVNTTVGLDRERIRELTKRERVKLDERTRASGAMYRRARESLSGGVGSTYQAREPWPIYLTTGEGSAVYDVDGNRMWDFHNGFGSMVQGHAHPAIVRAVSERVALGTHFAGTTEDGVVVAEELKRRWGLERWR